MTKVEYLLFIPLLIYGIAIADLLSQWRRMFSVKSRFFPYMILTVILTEVAVYNVFSFLQKIDRLTDVNYAEYWLYLLPPLIFLLAVSALVVEKDEDANKEFFLKRVPVVFSLLAFYIFFHLLPMYAFYDSMWYLRIVLIALALLTAYTKNLNFFYVMALLWAASLFMRTTFKVV